MNGNSLSLKRVLLEGWGYEIDNFSRSGKVILVLVKELSILNAPWHACASGLLKEDISSSNTAWNNTKKFNIKNRKEYRNKKLIIKWAGIRMARKIKR